MNEQGRSTATVQRVDVSPTYHGASAVPAHPETTLFHAYRRSGDGVQTQRCVCGGYVHADPAAPGKGVAAHNHTARHKAWRNWRESD